MTYLFGYDLTPKKIEVLKKIYHYRGVTAEQLLTILVPSKYPLNFLENLKASERPSDLINLYTLLRNLHKQRLLNFSTMESQSRKKLFYLSKNGLEVVQLILNIKPGYHGSGFGDDYGEFPYELYKPPKTYFLHHLNLTDFFLKLNEIADRFKDKMKVLYRDNRYAATEYESPLPGFLGNKNFKFRPDAEVIMNGKTYFIEIDRGTEYLDALRSKFEGYQRYFYHLKREERPIPDGIIFISDEKLHDYGFNRRWLTLTQAFMEKARIYGSEVNLMATTINGLSRVIRKELEKDHIEQVMVDKMTSYLGNTTSKFFILDSKVVDFIRGDRCLYTITSYHDHDVLYGYFRVNGYELSGVSKANDLLHGIWYRKKFYSFLQRITKFVPVFYYMDQDFRHVSLKGFYKDEIAKKMYDSALFVNIAGDPLWYRRNGEAIQQNHAHLLADVGFDIPLQ